jgi:hypothetical protein
MSEPATKQMANNATFRVEKTFVLNATFLIPGGSTTKGENHTKHVPPKDPVIKLMLPFRKCTSDYQTPHYIKPIRSGFLPLESSGKETTEL